MKNKYCINLANTILRSSLHIMPSGLLRQWVGLLFSHATTLSIAQWSVAIRMSFPVYLFTVLWHTVHSTMARRHSYDLSCVFINSFMTDDHVGDTNTLHIDVWLRLLGECARKLIISSWSAVICAVINWQWPLDYNWTYACSHRSICTRTRACFQAIVIKEMAAVCRQN